MNTKVMEAVEKIRQAKADPEIRVCRRVEIGTVAVHQGDVYLHRVADGHPMGERTGSRQVAVGTTIGSRHIVVGDVEVFAGKQLPGYCKVADGFRLEDYLGPVVVAKDEFVLTHPEHAHHRCPAGTYQVTYQVDVTTMRRVTD